MIREIRPILLVEDSDADAEMTTDALGESRVANPVVRVRDGVEALDYLMQRNAFSSRDTHNPVVVLLDIKMPRLDGLEVLKQMRSNDALRRIPVVILTSSREESDVARSWDLGVNAYVVKPVDSTQFFAAVQNLGQFWAVLNETPGGD